MNNKELALLLGMLCGDGCLTIGIKKNGGYKCYATRFYNSSLNLINSFQTLFSSIFGAKADKANYCSDIRQNKKKITYIFSSYSREIFHEIASWGFPVGLKKYKLRIPQIIWNMNKREKLLFLKGFIITDGSIRKTGNVLFHVASKKFLEDIANLIDELFNLRKPIKEYIQRGKYLSYQLLLDKKEAQEVLAS